MIPRAKIDALENAPPENMLSNCIRPLESVNFFQSDQVGRIDARKHDVTPQSVNEYQQERYEDAFAQFLNGPNVFDCLNESHW